MVHSPLLDSFDPFATHPFTNNSGIIPQPPLPSTYPLYIPSSFAQSNFQGHEENEASDAACSLSSSGSVTPTQNSNCSSQLHSPQPRRYSSRDSPSWTTTTSSTRAVFGTLRKDAPSPELVLKKNVITSGDDSPSPRTK